MNRYSCDADDFYVNVNLNTEMELPTNRDTVLHFFEQMKKAFPGAAKLLHAGERRSGVRGGQGARDRIAGWRSSRAGSVRGMSIPIRSRRRTASTRWCWNWLRRLLTISLLDCEALDVMFGFDFNYDGNHDEVVAEALGVGPGAGRAARGAQSAGDQLRAVADSGPG